MRWLILLILLGVGVITVLEGIRKSEMDAWVAKQVGVLELQVPLNMRNMATGSGHVRELFQQNSVEEKQIQALMLRESLEQQSSVRIWSLGNVSQATATAYGVDQLHHFVNGYLLGFMPFHTDQAWVPLYTLANKLNYQLDHFQYPGTPEVWQNSVQAFFNTRGDCEDHALILADWLIGLGIEARVVMGTYKEAGHAWVVAYKDGSEYVLEATGKQKQTSWRHYPLASLATDYHPQYMFDRDFFWVNTGSPYTTRYSGERWVKVSQYIPAL